MEWFKRNISGLKPEELQRCLALMTPERRQRIEALHHEQRRLTSILGEWMAKAALAEQSGLPIGQITLLRTEKGKPYAEGLPHFSISHSGDWVAVALNECPIGIDIEVLRPIDLKLARRLCTESDLACLFDGRPVYEKTEDPALIRRFFEIWTAKEAYFKCIGTGITDLKAISYTGLQPLHFYQNNCIITMIKSP